jgi:HrpA-like RNA helicase
MLGALDGFGEITDLGVKMSRLPLDPPLSRMLLESLERHVRYHCAVLTVCGVWCDHVMLCYVMYVLYVYCT